LSRKENEKLQAVGEDIRKETGFNPELLLEIEQRKLQNQLEQIKLEEEILEDYLDLIEETNFLCSTDKNLLSKS